MRKFAEQNLDIQQEVSFFSMRMEPHTVQTGHKSYCSHLTGNFSTIHPTGLTLPHQIIIRLSHQSNTSEITDPAVMRR
jgi:hypothetical protein